MLTCILQLVQSVRTVFRSGLTKTIEWRKAQLMAMLKLLDENRDRLCDALQQDLHKVCIYSGCLYIQWMFVFIHPHCK